MIEPQKRLLPLYVFRANLYLAYEPVRRLRARQRHFSNPDCECF